MRTAKAVLAITLGCLAISAVAAGSAQAEESEWQIDSETFSQLGLKEEKTSIGGAPIVLSVPALGLTLECGVVEGTGKVFEGGTNEITAKLTKCAVSKFKLCTVNEPITLEAKSESILAGESYYDKLVPLKEGKALAVVSFSNEECALPPKSEVKGAVAGRIPIEEEPIKQPLELSEAISKGINSNLKAAGEAELNLTFGKSTAFLTGKLITALTGANSGKEWSRAEFTRLCKVRPAAGRNNCGAGNYWPALTTITLGKEVSTWFKFGTEFTCAESSLEATTTTDGRAPMGGIIWGLEFENCEKGACSATAQVPRAFSAETWGAGRGTFTIIQPIIEFMCASFEEPCVYWARSVQLFTSGGEPAKFTSHFPERMMRLSGQPPCAGEATWGGTEFGGAIKYEGFAPAKLFLTAR